MRPEEKQNWDNQEKKVYRLTETKNKFSLLKDEMSNTIPWSADLKLQDQPKKEEKLQNVIGERKLMKTANQKKKKTQNIEWSIKRMTIDAGAKQEE